MDLKALKSFETQAEADCAQRRVGTYRSRRLSRALIGMGLVDELRLLVYPLVLVPEIACSRRQDKIALRLVESRRLGGGVVNMIYAPATADG